MPPSPPPNLNLDPKYLIPYYDTKLGKAFDNPERYARLLPHSYEAGKFRRGAYDLASFTCGHLHPNYPSSRSYAQAASGSGSDSKKKKASKPPSPQHVVSAAALPPLCTTTVLRSSPLPSPSPRRPGNCSNLHRLRRSRTSRISLPPSSRILCVGKHPGSHLSHGHG